MALNRPLKGYSGGLKELTDDEISYIEYELRVAYATYLATNTTGYGAVYVGGTGNITIGSFTDTKRTQGVSATGSGGYSGQTGLDDDSPDEGSSGTGPPTSHDTGDYPTAVATGTTNVTSYTYRQNQNEPNEPTATVYGDDSYLVGIQVTAGTLGVEGDDADIFTTILEGAIAEMRTGDEVGTYRVSTSDPSSTDTWDDMGTFFIDTNYDGTVATYKLWLKRSLSGGNPGTSTEIAGWDDGEGKDHIINRSASSTSNLVVNVLLPLLQRRITESLKYEVVDTEVAARSRGAINDNRLDGTTTSYQHVAPPTDTYTTTTTPSGSNAIHATKYFQIV